MQKSGLIFLSENERYQCSPLLFLDFFFLLGVSARLSVSVTEEESRVGEEEVTDSGAFPPTNSGAGRDEGVSGALTAGLEAESCSYRAFLYFL